jgi:hypothetical protein
MNQRYNAHHAPSSHYIIDKYNPMIFQTELEASTLSTTTEDEPTIDYIPSRHAHLSTTEEL